MNDTPKKEEDAALVRARDELDQEDDALAMLKSENDKLRQDYLRALADMENLKKRHVRERSDAEKYSTARLLKDVLSVQDNVLRALSVSLGEQPDPMALALFDGLGLIRSDLERFLKNQGIAQVEAMGKTFDPDRHQVVSEVASDDKVPGEIVDVIQNGYMLHDRLLRPAMVVTAKGPDR